MGSGASVAQPIARRGMSLRERLQFDLSHPVQKGVEVCCHQLNVPDPLVVLLGVAAEEQLSSGCDSATEWIGVDKKIDVLGGSHVAVENDGEATDQDVARLLVVQRSAEGDEVFELRRARVATIIVIIHSSASSCVSKR